MSTFKLTPEVRAELEKATFDGNKLLLAGQIADRKLYAAVAKTIENAGGKWNRGAGCHLFPGDVREALGMTMETGVSRDAKVELQAFFTPPELASEAVRWACVNGRNVLEPSCGDGALAVECLAQGAKSVTGIEIDIENCRKAVVRSGKSHFYPIQTDFLAMTPKIIGMFDRVVMNPPFTRNQYVAHVLHAFRFLNNGGALVAILPNSVTSSPFQKIIKHLEAYGSTYEIRPIAAGAFKTSGTMVNTVMLVVSLYYSD